MTTPTVVCIGELLWDELPTGPVLGGAPCNVAYRLHTLGVPVAMISRVGQDSLGEEALAVLRQQTVPTEWIQRDSKRPTGTVDVKINADGNPSYTINQNVAYDAIEATPEVCSLVAKARAICFGTLVQRAPIARESLQLLLNSARDSERVLDINLRRDCYTRETVDWSLRSATVLKLNRSEVEVLVQMLGYQSGSLSGFCGKLFESYPLRTCIITLGECGALAIERNGGTVYEPGHRLTIVDTIGSGDSFTAGFIACKLRGSSLAESVRYGNVLGALAATRRGAMALIPEAEISALVLKRGDVRCEPDLLR